MYFEPGFKETRMPPKIIEMQKFFEVGCFTSVSLLGDFEKENLKLKRHFLNFS